MKPLAILFSSLLVLTACQPKQPVVTGQVFIATQGGTSVKLGGISVLAVPAEVAARREADTLAAAQREREQAAAAHAAWFAAKNIAEEAVNRAQLEVNSSRAEVARLDRIRLQNLTAATRVADKHRADAERAIASVADLLKQAEAKAKADGAELDRLQKAFQQAATGEPAKPAEILAAMPRLASLKWPEAVAQATTDADGRFTLRPPAGALALVAVGQRTLLGKEVELYFWRVPVPTGDAAEVMLTGENARIMTGYRASGRKLDSK